MARPARGPGALCFLGSPRPRAQSFMPRPRAQSVQCFNAAGAQPPPRDGPGPGEAAPVAQREGWWLVGWLSCEVAQGPKDVSDWASSAVPAPQCAAASSSRPPSAGPGSSRPEMRSQCARRDSRGSSPDPVRVVCPLFAGATAAQPGDAALTGGSSLQPLAQPSNPGPRFG